MNNKLANKQMPGWGEDLSGFLVLCRQQGDDELAIQVEEKLLASYLLALRQKFQSDQELRRVVIDCKPALSAAPYVIDRLWDLSRTGSEDVFEKAVKVILEELEVQRANPPSMYLVNMQTGRATVPLNEETVYQPPDFVGEDGLVHKARPVVHPSITSAMALAQQAQAKQDKLTRMSKDPQYRDALAHLNPEEIVKSAKMRLEAVGISILTDIPETDSTKIEFGREQIDGIGQDPNYGFHRLGAFAAVLATKILKICGPNGKCYLGPFIEKKNSKQKWFVIDVWVGNSPAALPS